MSSKSSKRKEKYNLLTDKTEAESCDESASREPSVDEEAGFVRVRKYIPWQTFDPAWKSWYFFVPPILIFSILSWLAFFPSCETCQKMNLDTSGYVCAPNGALPKIARDRGCEFDTMSFKWWPKEPMAHKDNVALVKDFYREGPWHRYYDKGGKHEIPPTSEVLTAGWVTRKEHTYHCMYTLRQTHLWMVLGYDPPFNYSHTIHCTKYLMDAILENPPKDFEELNVHGTPWPEHPDIVKPYYPCKQEGLSCESW
ncbi:hypothetical protein CORC01_00822 [Colletotrichum orchidophilum]|uniref:Uncharacterized protein n=1 Tax=Colletotrichum orchidophilum TaxID=1209926 RepID=A0A1G4BRB9_9PEZI|nr:uncharacterized protein CORC01_00822 [Colletotrichum orchidophilum]OHF03960.1 hypothetical protein CORC01_00822 [Colletotrichum orchidophilum]